MMFTMMVGSSLVVEEDFPLLGPMGASIKKMFQPGSNSQNGLKEAEQYMNNGQQAKISKDFERAADMFSSAATLYRTIGNRNLQAQATIRVAEILSRMGKTIEAQDLFEEASNIYADTDHKPGNALLNRLYGEHYARHGVLDEAIERCNYL